MSRALLVVLFIAFVRGDYGGMPSAQELAMLEAQSSQLTGVPVPDGVQGYGSQQAPAPQVQGPSDEQLLRRSLEGPPPQIALPPVEFAPAPMRFTDAQLKKAQHQFDLMSPFGTAVPADNSDLVRQEEKIASFPMPEPFPGESEDEYIQRCEAERLKRQGLLSIVVEEARRRAEIRNPVQPPPHEGVTWADLPAPPGRPDFSKISADDVFQGQREFDDMSPFGEVVPDNDFDIDEQRLAILDAPPPQPFSDESEQHFLLRCEEAKLQREEALSVLMEEQRRRQELRMPLDAQLAYAQQQVLARAPEGAAGQEKQQQALIAIRHEAEHRQEANVINSQLLAQRDQAFTAMEDAEFAREQAEAVVIPQNDDEAEVQRRVDEIRQRDLEEEAERERLDAAAREDVLHRQAAEAAAALQQSMSKPFGGAPMEDQSVIGQSISAMKNHVLALENKIRAINEGPLQDEDSSDSDAMLE